MLKKLASKVVSKTGNNFVWHQTKKMKLFNAGTKCTFKKLILSRQWGDLHMGLTSKTRGEIIGCADTHCIYPLDLKKDLNEDRIYSWD